MTTTTRPFPTETTGLPQALWMAARKRGNLVGNAGGRQNAAPLNAGNLPGTSG